MSKKLPQTSSRKSSLRPMLALLRARIATDEEGATAIEYALIASGIGAAVAATVWSLGSTTNSFYASLAALMP
jgi:pilus assembly protein Flp/PilA